MGKPSDKRFDQRKNYRSTRGKRGQNNSGAEGAKSRRNVAQGG